MEKPKRRPYSARMEYRTVQPDVEAMLERGYSVKIMFEELSAAGRLTMAYKTFCDYVRGGGQRLHGKKKIDQKQAPVPNSPGRRSSPVTTPKKTDLPDKSEPFKIERIPLEELI